MCVSCHRRGKFERTNKGQDGVWKSRSPVVEQVDNLEDCRHHVIQVIVIGSFKDREGLFGQYKEGGGRGVQIVIWKGVGARECSIATFEGR